jgi:hypothetical protein
LARLFEGTAQQRNDASLSINSHCAQRRVVS